MTKAEIVKHLKATYGNVEVDFPGINTVRIVSGALVIYKNPAEFKRSK
jgi:hypothetical protein